MTRVPAATFPKNKRFELISRLGTGGLGVVYKAFDREKQETVALKTLKATDPQAIFRLKNEFRSLQDLQHRNLVSLGELFEADGRWYFTMELVEGVDFVRYVRREESFNGKTAGELFTSDGSAQPKTISGRTGVTAPHPSVQNSFETSSKGECTDGGCKKQGKFDEHRLRGALLQLVDGLSALHGAGSVHRDIKPSNILVSREGRVVLLDFGLARHSTPGELSTEHGGPLGTMAYMAPEQASSDKVGPEADWYSVGVVIYEGITGCLPFEGSLFDILLAKQMDSPPRPSSKVPETPGDLDDLCFKLMNKDPAKRPDANEVHSVLEQFTPSAKPTSPTRYKTRTPVFVGREKELENLYTALALSKHGPRVMLVHGASGLGKSELLRVFAQKVSEGPRDTAILFGRCYERESVPFKAFDGVVDALSRLLQKIPEKEGLPLVPRDAALLLKVFPVLGRVSIFEAQATPRRIVEDVQTVRTFAFNALRELLCRLGDRQPVLIVIDDFQWADDDSRRLLSALLRPPEAPAICLVLTLRTPADPRLAANAVESVKKSVPMELREITIEAFSYEMSVNLARKLFTKAPEDEKPEVLAEKIGRESEGHPFFIQEMVRYAEDGGGTSKTLTLDGVLEERISSLDVQARELLELVCTAGAPLQQDLISTILDEKTADTARMVAQLRWMNLLRSRGPRPEDTVEPYHDRVLEWISRRQDPQVRRKKHMQIFTALKATGNAPPEKLAMHLEEAGEKNLAAHYAAEAAGQAAKLFAFDRAAALYRKALENRPPSDLPEAIDERRKLLVRLAESLAGAGRANMAAETYLEAAVGATAAEALKLEHLAASQLLISGRLDQGLVIIKRVAKRLGVRIPNTPLAALISLLLRRLRVRLGGLRFQLKDPSTVSHEELERVDLWRSLALGLSVSDHMRAADFNTRWVAKALKLGEPGRVVQALATEFNFVASLGKHHTRYFQRLKDTVKSINVDKEGSKVSLAYLMGGEGNAFFEDGKWRAALEAMEKAESLMPNSTSAFHELATARFTILWSLFYLGELKAMTRVMVSHLRTAMDRGDFFAASGMVLGLANTAYLNRKGPEAASREVDKMLDRWSAEGYHLQHYWALLARVHIALYTGSGKEALKLMQTDKKALKKSLLLLIPAVANESLNLEAKALLGAAEESEQPEKNKLLSRAEKLTHKLRRKKHGWIQSLSMLLEGAVHFQRGNDELAKSRLEAAIEALYNQEMKLYAAASRWRLAGLLDGNDKEKHLTEAQNFMASQNIKNMECMVNLLAPGFSRNPEQN